MAQKTNEEKNHLIKLWRESGLTVSEWCEQHQIPKTTFYGWLNIRKPKTALRLSQSDFQSIENRLEAVKLKLSYQGVVMKISGEFNPYVVRECLSALRGC